MDNGWMDGDDDDDDRLNRTLSLAVCAQNPSKERIVVSKSVRPEMISCVCLRLTVDQIII
jgi:hypothetical protein